MLSLPEKYGHRCTSQTTDIFICCTYKERSSEVTYALANKDKRDILNVTGLEFNQLRNQAIETCCPITYSSKTAILYLLN